MPLLEDIDLAAGRAGLALRGVARLEPSERIGELTDVRSIVLLGMVGGENWPAFAESSEASDGAPNPLDRWSLRIVGGLADAFGALALYPFGGAPYWPFQAWARRADAVWPSPLGLLIHPQFGLWHSYRGALGFAEAFDARAPSVEQSPCDLCLEKPCLNTCPVGAFSPGRYDVEACARHLRRSEGSKCMEGGCFARRACPIGREYTYKPDQSAFYMQAFLRGRSAAAD